MTRGLRDSTKVRREYQEAKPIRKRVRIENTVGRQTMDQRFPHTRPARLPDRPGARLTCLRGGTRKGRSHTPRVGCAASAGGRPEHIHHCSPLLQLRVRVGEQTLVCSAFETLAMPLTSNSENRPARMNYAVGSVTK